MPKKKGSVERQSAGRAADPAPQAVTKKDVEARQQALKEDNHRKVLERIQQHSLEKETDAKSIFEAHTLVQSANGFQADEVPDLSQKWVELHKIEFLAFLPQDNAGRTEPGALLGAGNEREDVLRYANKDCATMLRLPHHEFWSHVVHNRSFQRFKDTYLRHCRRYFDSEWSALAMGEAHRQPPPPSKVESDLARRVFFILLRMSQPRESPTAFMTEEEFGRLIYDEWLWDVPAMLDLAVVYGRANQELAGQIVSRLMSHQPGYEEDLAAAGVQIGSISRRRGGHFAGAPSPSLLKRLLEGEMGCS